jgi:hypothetical protein
MPHFVGKNKVRFTKEEVSNFIQSWPGVEDPQRSYWFEFDDNDDLVDTDVPNEQDGSWTVALAYDAKEWRESNRDAPISSAPRITRPIHITPDLATALSFALMLLDVEQALDPDSRHIQEQDIEAFNKNRGTTVELEKVEQYMQAIRLLNLQIRGELFT